MTDVVARCTVKGHFFLLFTACPGGFFVADLVGDYLFTDSDFIGRLSAENRGVFDKLFDEIKYLCKVATVGSKEARQLEKVKKAFENAYRAETKNPTVDGGTKYSLGSIVDTSGNNYGIGVHLDSTLLDTLTPAERVGMVKEYVKEIGGESFTAYDQKGKAVDITIAKSNAKFKNRNGKRVAATKDLTNKHINNEVKQEAIALIDELITAAEYDTSSAARYPHGWLDNNGKNDWEYWTTYIQDKDNTIWEATLNVANSANGEKILYDIGPIKKVGRAIKLATLPTTNNIPQGSTIVNTPNSLSSADDVTQPVRGGVYGKDVLLEGLDAISENRDAGQDIAESELVAGLETIAKGSEVESEYDAPFPSEEDLMDAELREMDDAYRVQAEGEGYASSLYDSGEGSGVDTVARRLEVKRQNARFIQNG